MGRWKELLYTPALKFSKNGEYDVNIYDKKEPKEPSSDYSAVNFSNPGDKFYLLILQGKQKDVILKCFNAKYYEIFADDFDYTDGKYYPKKASQSLESAEEN